MNKCEILDEQAMKQFDSFGDKTILVGAKSTGKTTVLKEYYNHTNNDKTMVVMFDFNDFFNIPLTYDEKSMYVQLSLAKSVLDCVVSDDRVVGYYKKLIDNILVEFINFTTCRPYLHETKFSYRNKTLLDEVINAMKITLKKDSIILIVDKFDQIYYSNKDYQELFMDYGRYFDKVIVSSEDEEVLQPSEVERLKPKGYDVVDVKKMFNYETIKNMILSKFFNYKKVSINLCRMLTSEKLLNLYNLTGGNFNIMKDVLDEINNETSIVDDFYVISKISEHVNRYNEMASYYNGVRGYKRTLHL